MEKDLKWIKKRYGETMMHLCRSLFPQILEQENLLPMLLEEHFPHSKFLAKDIIEQDRKDDFKGYIFSLIDVEKKEKVDNSKKNAIELMREAGYVLYPECKSEKDIQSFRKFWDPREELCTFRGGRLRTCRVWFALKENIEDIKRKDFKNPQRQDEYGTSAISIQFSRGSYSTLSIKNRYNHTVNNPDNTFNSNLDNIKMGLADAFERDYGVRDCNTSHNRLDLDNYVCVGGKYYHYNYEMNNVYYCDNNVIIDNFRVKHLPQSQILIGYHIFDTSAKSVYLYDDKINDCFSETFGEIEQISHSDGELCIKVKDGEDIKIGLDSRNRMVSLDNKNMTTCGKNFLGYDETIEQLNLPNLTECGNNFFFFNNNLKNINLSSLEICGNNFLKRNESLNSLSLPHLRGCGDSFLYENANISNIYLPALQRCGSDFLYQSKTMTSLDLHCLEECGDAFMRSNENLSYFNAPKLRKCGNDFMCHNDLLTKINLPSLKEVGDYFLQWNRNITSVNFPSLEVCGDKFLLSARAKDLYAPLLKKCGSKFLYNAHNLTSVDLPNLEECGDEFLRYCEFVEEVNLPLLRKCGDKFLFYCDGLLSLNLPMLEECGDDFLYWAKHLTSIYLPKLKKCGSFFMVRNQKVSQLEFLNLISCGNNFMPNNKKSIKINFPNLEICGSEFLPNISPNSELNIPNLLKEKIFQENSNQDSTSETNAKNKLQTFIERIVGRGR